MKAGSKVWAGSCFVKFSGASRYVGVIDGCVVLLFLGESNEPNCNSRLAEGESNNLGFFE